MLIPELRAFTTALVSMPFVATAHEASLAVLRKSFARAGFQIERSVCCALVAPSAAPAYWGGFEVYDSASDAKLRVMASLGYSTARQPMSTAAGFALKWLLTPAAAPAIPMTAQERRMLTHEVGAHRISMQQLASLTAAAVTAHFDEALSATRFRATPDQADEFVASVVAVLAP